MPVSRAEMMSSGSLTIGGTDFNYGGNCYNGGAWTGNNTAGLMMECSDNTEIVIHDGGTRLASFMYYSGGTNKFTIGRDMGWGALSQTIFNGNVGIGTDNARGKLDVSGGAIVARATNESGSTALYFGTPYTPNSALKCALICED